MKEFKDFTIRNALDIFHILTDNSYKESEEYSIAYTFEKEEDYTCSVEEWNSYEIA